MGGGGLYNFVTDDRLVNPGQNPAFPTGGFSVWNRLQGVEEMIEAIAASYEDMAVLDGKNVAADQIIWAAWVVLWVLVGHLATQQGLGTCWYLLDRLLGTHCPLVWALRYLIVTIDEIFPPFLGKVVTIH